MVKLRSVDDAHHTERNISEGDLSFRQDPQLFLWTIQESPEYKAIYTLPRDSKGLGPMLKGIALFFTFLNFTFSFFFSFPYRIDFSIFQIIALLSTNSAHLPDLPDLPTLPISKAWQE